MAWEDDQARIFGADKQAALNDRMQQDFRRRPPRGQARREPEERGGDMQGDQGWDHAGSGSRWAAVMSDAQSRHLHGMGAQIGAAMSEENDSRVAQARELRRMQHERELKRMELDALLARLESARQPSGPAPRVTFRGGAIY